MCCRDKRVKLQPKRSIANAATGEKRKIYNAIWGIRNLEKSTERSGFFAQAYKPSS